MSLSRFGTPFTTPGQETEWALFLQPRSHGANDREHSVKVDYTLARSSDTERMPQQALGGPWFQDGTRQAKGKLERCSPDGSTRMGLTWEEADAAAFNRQEWRQSVSKCVYMDAGWITGSSSIMQDSKENKQLGSRESWSIKKSGVKHRDQKSTIFWSCHEAQLLGTRHNSRDRLYQESVTEEDQKQRG